MLSRTAVITRCVALLLCLLGPSALAGAARTAPETLPAGASCSDSGCHGELVDAPDVHGPAEQDCALCHQQQGDRHAFEMPMTGAELCTTCHESVSQADVVHAPLAMGAQACTVCHDPHSSAHPAMLAAESPGKLCLNCHGDFGGEDRLHELGMMGGCTACHQPHSGELDGLLKTETPDLCFTCHADVQQDIQEAQTVHGPAAMGCVTCHDAHRRGAGHGLSSTGTELCMTCHAHFAETLELMQQRHSLPLQEEGCNRCHEPHAGAEQALLSATSMELCLHCHREPIEREEEVVVKGLGEELTEDAMLHGPLAAGNCALCHEPHANERRGFLRGNYPAGIYAPWSREAYSFCFECHDTALVAEDRTETATAFRDGPRSLHNVHVQRDRKGRTCRLCHTAHASETPHLLRRSIQFGEWELPIGWEPLPNGGTCASGCHRAESYERGSEEL